MSAVIIGLGLLYALTRPRVSHAALATLGVITDTEYLTLDPVGLLPAVEITTVSISKEPVPGSYAGVWVYLKANSPSPAAGVFCRIIDDDTGAIVGVKKNWYLVVAGDTWIAKYDWVDDWNVVMPNRVWNLRIEVGTN